MSDGNHFKIEQLELQLQAFASSIQSLAEEHRGDSLALLALLRLLEKLHQEIRDSLFQESLPDNRQALYSLLRDIEASGGWPYIHRMKLQTLLANMSSHESEDRFTTLSAFIPNKKPPELE